MTNLQLNSISEIARRLPLKNMKSLRIEMPAAKKHIKHEANKRISAVSKLQALSRSLGKLRASASQNAKKFKEIQASLNKLKNKNKNLSNKNINNIKHTVRQNFIKHRGATNAYLIGRNKVVNVQNKSGGGFYVTVFKKNPNGTKLTGYTVGNGSNYVKENYSFNKNLFNVVAKMSR